MKTSKEIRDAHQRHLWPSVRNYYEEPVALVEGNGCVVKDADHREYLDFFGGILTVSLGHRHKKVNEAIHQQVDRILHTSTLYPSEPMVELAQKLASITPDGLTTSFFTPSGTDADETAVMAAQVFTGRQEVVVLRNGYAGRSYSAQAITGQAPWRQVSTQLAFYKHAHAPYCYRCDLGLKYPDCGLQCAKDIEGLIQTTTKGEIAAFLAEPIQGVGGFVTPPKEYFEVATAVVRKYGGVFICDEVQTGFGRTGGHMWGIEHWNVKPDLMTMAKGIANGLPLGAVITRPEIAQNMKALTISTFGGNPVSCAAALATLRVIEGEGLIKHVEAMGARLRSGLEQLQRDFPRVVGEVRGKGLMQAVEFVVDEKAGDRTPNPKLCGAFFEAVKKRGVLIGRGGLFSNVLRIAPPMTIDRGQIDQALRVFGEALADVGRS